MLAPQLKRWWFVLTTLAARWRFRAGRASFVECEVTRTDSEMTPIVDPKGLPLETKLLARHSLANRPPRAGAAGWALYEERLLAPGPHRFASLECAHCGHLYVIQISAEKPALAAPDGRPLAIASDFRSDWFRFAPSTFDAPAALSCPRCEERAAPTVTHLHEP